MPHPRVFGRECRGVVQVGRGLECHGGHALQVAFDESDQRPSRRQFQHAGDAQRAKGLHAQVPADRPGDLGDQQLEVGLAPEAMTEPSELVSSGCVGIGWA